MRYQVRRWVFLGVLPLLLGLSITLPDWRFLSRAITYPKTPILSSHWYRPMATVPGNPQAPLPVAEPTNVQIPQAALETITEFAIAQNSTALLVMHQGEVVLEKYWQRQTATTITNGMSMTKTILALLIGIAIEEGHIQSVNDRVSDYLPEWRHDSRASLTLEDLLYMHSGLRNDRRTDTPFSDLVQLYMSSDVEQVALNIPQVAPPRQTYDYNNVNSLILSLVLERATGESFADYLSSRLWQPLGAKNGRVWLDRPGGRAKPFCCFFATASDWARLGQMILDRGRVGDQQVVPAAWINQMLTPSPLEPTFGLHIWVQARTPDHANVDTAATEGFLADDTFYLDGRHHQRVYGVPSHDLVIVRIGESPEIWDDAFLPNTLVRALDAVDQASMVPSSG